jgi:hypothetical protein
VDLETVPVESADQVEVEPVHHDGWSNIDAAVPGDRMTGQVEYQEAVAEGLTTETDTDDGSPSVWETGCGDTWQQGHKHAPSQFRRFFKNLKIKKKVGR